MSFLKIGLAISLGFLFLSWILIQPQLALVGLSLLVTLPILRMGGLFLLFLKRKESVLALMSMLVIMMIMAGFFAGHLA